VSNLFSIKNSRESVSRERGEKSKITTLPSPPARLGRSSQLSEVYRD